MTRRLTIAAAAALGCIAVVGACSCRESAVESKPPRSSIEEAEEPVAVRTAPSASASDTASTAADASATVQGRQGPPSYFAAVPKESEWPCPGRRPFLVVQCTPTNLLCSVTAGAWLRQILAAHPEFRLMEPPPSRKSFYGRCAVHEKSDLPSKPGEVVVLMHDATNYDAKIRGECLYVRCADRATCNELAAALAAIVPPPRTMRCPMGAGATGPDLIALGPWRVPEALPADGDLRSACARVTACWMREGGSTTSRNTLCASLSDEALTGCSQRTTCAAVKTCTEQGMSPPDAAAIKRRRPLYPWPPAT